MDVQHMGPEFERMLEDTKRLGRALARVLHEHCCPADLQELETAIRDLTATRCAASVCLSHPHIHVP